MIQARARDPPTPDYSGSRMAGIQLRSAREASSAIAVHSISSCAGSAAQAVEHVAGQALRVNPDQRRIANRKLTILRTTASFGAVAHSPSKP